MRIKLNHILKFFISSICIFCITNFYGQNTKLQDNSAKIKAVFIYNFTKYFKWQNEKKLDTFRIGTLGASEDLVKELKKFERYKKLTSGKPIKIIVFKNIKEMTQVEMLYFNYNNVKKRPTYFLKNMLVIEDESPDIEKSMLAFVVKEGKFRFAVNEKLVTNAKLIMNPDLSSLAITISGNNSNEDKDKAKEWASVFDKINSAMDDNAKNLNLTKGELESIVNSFNEKENLIKEKETNIKEKENELTEKKQKLSEQQKIVDSQNQILNEQKKQIDNQLSQILSKEQELKLQEQKLSITIEQNKQQEKSLQIAILGKEDILKKIDEQKIILRKQQNEMDNQKNKLIVQLEKINSQKTILYLAGFLVFVIGTALLIAYKSNKNKQRANMMLSKQKIEIESQKHLLEEKQKEIVDSITYAKRLQQAILPPKEFIKTHFPESFILYKPKDIVAGDFYWAEIKNDKFFIAAADSTGHGVPGAMVSVVCSNALNRSVNEFGLTDTAKILDKTRELVIQTFEKSNEEVKDGMDISLLCIDKQHQKVFLSGANNPLWFIQNSVISSEVEKSTSIGINSARSANQLFEIKADKQPVGKSYELKPFTSNEIEFKSNTIFYLFTDGLADQFGGPNGKKFKYKQFEEMLLSISHEKMTEQANYIHQKFEDWKGNLEQVDDVCVIGIKI